MMTVRFSTGFSVQYNDANWASRSETHTDLYDKKGGRWLAQVPMDALIEVAPNCRAYDAMNSVDACAAQALEIKRLSNKVGRALRSAKRGRS